MRTLLQVLFAVWFVGAGALAISGLVDDPTDWIVFGVLVSAVPGVALAVWHRQYPPPSRKRNFRREPGSDW